MNPDPVAGTEENTPAPLEPLQKAVLDQLPTIEGPNAEWVRELTREIALISYRLGWDIAHATFAEERS